MSADDAYSQVADKQLDSLEAGPDSDLYNAVLGGWCLLRVVDLADVNTLGE